jgi:hypothetical protein
MVEALTLSILLVAIVGVVDLAPDNRLDAGITAIKPMLERPVHHTVIGQSKSWLIKFSGSLGKSIDAAVTVERRILRVNVKMDCLRSFAHQCSNLGSPPDDAISGPLRLKPAQRVVQTISCLSGL